MDLGAELKKRGDNPNLRSAHYTRQSAFEGSDRKIRGSVLRLLINSNEKTEEDLIHELCGDPERIRKLITALEIEGFLVRDGARIRLKQ